MFQRKASFPKVFCFSEPPEKATKALSGCMFKKFLIIKKDETVSFNEGNLKCKDDKLYLGFGHQT